MLIFGDFDEYGDINIILDDGRGIGQIIEDNTGYGVYFYGVCYQSDYLRQIADKLDELNHVN